MTNQNTISIRERKITSRKICFEISFQEKKKEENILAENRDSCQIILLHTENSHNLLNLVLMFYTFSEIETLYHA